MSAICSWLQTAEASATAVTDDSETVTYGELTLQAAQLASAYSTFGTSRFLLIPAMRKVAFIRALVATLLSGNIPVPVDPQAPSGAIASIGEQCGEWSLVDLDIEFESCSPVAQVGSDSRQPELVLFTSGTSGRPKGVPISTGNLEHAAPAVSTYLSYKAYPSAAVVLPLHYSYALLTQVLFMFYTGGRVRLFESFRNPLSFSRVAKLENLGTFCGVPSTYRALGMLNEIATLCLPSFRVICSAGAALDRNLMPVIRRIFPNATLFDNYGMTEATPRISYISDDDPRFSEPTCGKPIDGLEVRSVDPATLAPLPDGEPGVIAIRGPSVFEGYLNDSEGTRAAFTPDRFLLSGDIGYLKDGYIYLQGRNDDVFNVGGEKVSPLEIEHALSKHANVLECAVARFQDHDRGDIPVAYIQLAAPADRQSLVAFLNGALSPAKVPVRYFEVRSFPLTGNGKLQRRQLTPDNTNFVVREIV